MKKTFLAMALTTICGSAMAQAPAFLSNGEYKVFTGYNHTESKSGDVKQKSDGITLSARADLPFNEQHGLRIEGAYGYASLDSEDTVENLTYSKGADAHSTDVYAGYTYTNALSDSTRFRGGLGLGYGTYKNNVHSNLEENAAGFDIKRKDVYAKVHGEIEQKLGSGWSLTPYAEVQFDINAKTTVFATQLGYSDDVTEKTNGWGTTLGMDISKQNSRNFGIVFGPYYKYREYKQSDGTLVDGEDTYIDKYKNHEFGLRVGLRF